MSNTAMNIFMFAAGAGIGAAATWIFAKKKYEKIIDTEIESVKETYAKRFDDETAEEETSTEETTVDSEDEEYLEYVGIRQAYISPDDSGDKLPSDKPYVIAPEEFGEREGYDQFTLTYYADSFLTDENDCLIEDVESIIGFDSLTRFGEYEKDSVHVRNDRLKCDYEILLDQRRYADVLKTKPYLLEDE